LINIFMDAINNLIINQDIIKNFRYLGEEFDTITNML
jgi:hypothetical protein